ncbi:hypothetical protein GVN20_18310 [Runella sp. CRIBMP]|uniref:hypothetical protein n=1 Tax=Runella sp. CRIBMP TaxID=2683261 RepID=UPI0014134F6E|nr:hypothetical protein [Runella sp. CRIBMP]NBB21325.1 hypothetical protein [Runella sp. CRIBMP]
MGAYTHLGNVEILEMEVITLGGIFTAKLTEFGKKHQLRQKIMGKTAIGRATIEVLELNRWPLINLRRALIAIGEHPPK